MYYVSFAGIAEGEEVANIAYRSLLVEVGSLHLRYEPNHHLSNATDHGTVVKSRAVLEEVRFVVERTLNTSIDQVTLDGL